MGLVRRGICSCCLFEMISCRLGNGCRLLCIVVPVFVQSAIVVGNSLVAMVLAACEGGILC